MNDVEMKTAPDEAVDEATLLRLMVHKTFELGQAALSAYQAGELVDPALATLCGEILALEAQILDKTAEPSKVAEMEEVPVQDEEFVAEDIFLGPVEDMVEEEILDQSPLGHLEDKTEAPVEEAVQPEPVEQYVEENLAEAAFTESAVSWLSGCPNCGEEVQPGRKFCTNCGFKLDKLNESDPPVPVQAAEEAQPEPDIPAPVIDQLICAHCASPIRPDARFCTSCGQPVAHAEEDAEDTMIDGHGPSIEPTSEPPDVPANAVAVGPDKFCDNCGRGLPAEAVICPDCGGTEFS